MRQVFWVFAFIFSFFNMAVGQPKEPWEPMALMGKKSEEQLKKAKVKTVRLLVFEVDNQGKIAKKGKLRNETRYNRQGKNIESRTDMNGAILVNLTDYDMIGNITKRILFDGSGNALQFAEYEYGWDGSFIGTHYRSGDGQSTFTKATEKKLGDTTLIYSTSGILDSKSFSTYDSINRIYLSRLLDPDNKLMYENKYLLNEQLQILEWSVVDHYQGRRTITKFNYDSSGNVLEEIEYDLSGNINYRLVHEYNKKHLETLTTMYKPGDNLFQVFKYRYKYY